MFVSVIQLVAVTERSEQAGRQIWPSWTAHLYIAVSVLDFFLARDISFYEYVVQRSAVKRDGVLPYARWPEVLSAWSVVIWEGFKDTFIQLYNVKR